MKKTTVFVIAVFWAAFALAQQQTQNNAVTFPSANSYNQSQLTYKIISVADNTFGYDVYADGRLLIHQTTIPAMPENDGFTNKTDAEKIATLVISKIKKGEMPPTVSVEEMKRLKVIR